MSLGLVHGDSLLTWRWHTLTILLRINAETCGLHDVWWCHQMETFSALLALCEEKPPFMKASDAELWCFFLSAPEQTVEQAI